MILSPAELAYVDSLGLCITEECDGCGKLLNQTVRYTITQKPEVDCSVECRDFASFGDRREVSKHAGKRRCANCGGSWQTKKRGAVYRDDVCRKRPTRTGVPPDPTNPGIDREVIEVAGWRGPSGLRFSYGAYRRAELKLCASLRPSYPEHNTSSLRCRGGPRGRPAERETFHRNDSTCSGGLCPPRSHPSPVRQLTDTLPPGERGGGEGVGRRSPGFL